MEPRDSAILKPPPPTSTQETWLKFSKGEFTVMEVLAPASLLFLQGFQDFRTNSPNPQAFSRLHFLQRQNCS